MAATPSSTCFVAGFQEITWTGAGPGTTPENQQRRATSDSDVQSSPSRAPKNHESLDPQNTDWPKSFFTLFNDSPSTAEMSAEPKGAQESLARQNVMDIGQNTQSESSVEEESDSLHDNSSTGRLRNSLEDLPETEPLVKNPRKRKATKVNSVDLKDHKKSANLKEDKDEPAIPESKNLRKLARGGRTTRARRNPKNSVASKNPRSKPPLKQMDNEDKMLVDSGLAANEKGKGKAGDKAGESLSQSYPLHLRRVPQGVGLNNGDSVSIPDEKLPNSAAAYSLRRHSDVNEKDSGSAPSSQNADKEQLPQRHQTRSWLRRNPVQPRIADIIVISSDSSDTNSSAEELGSVYADNSGSDSPREVVPKVVTFEESSFRGHPNTANKAKITIDGDKNEFCPSKSLTTPCPSSDYPAPRAVPQHTQHQAGTHGQNSTPPLDSTEISVLERLPDLKLTDSLNISRVAENRKSRNLGTHQMTTRGLVPNSRKIGHQKLADPLVALGEVESASSPGSSDILMAKVDCNSDLAPEKGKRRRRDGYFTNKKRRIAPSRASVATPHQISKSRTAKSNNILQPPTPAPSRFWPQKGPYSTRVQSSKHPGFGDDDPFMDHAPRETPFHQRLLESRSSGARSFNIDDALAKTDECSVDEAYTDAPNAGRKGRTNIFQPKSRAGKEVINRAQENSSLGYDSSDHADHDLLWKSELDKNMNKLSSTVHNITTVSPRQRLPHPFSHCNGPAPANNGLLDHVALSQNQGGRD